MNRRIAASLGLTALGLIALAGPHAASAQNGGWVTLFDGRNLDNFTQTGGANWRIVDGAAQADKGMMGYLVTKMPYGDFELRAEFWVDDDANSGIFIRCDDAKMPGGAACYEVNIYDTRPEQDYATGAIVNVAKVAQPAPKAGGKWNTYDITAKGPLMTAVLNGVKTAEGSDAKHPRGYIALQYGAGVVKFRKVEIRPL